MNELLNSQARQGAPWIGRVIARMKGASRVQVLGYGAAVTCCAAALLVAAVQEPSVGSAEEIARVEWSVNAAATRPLNLDEMLGRSDASKSKDGEPAGLPPMDAHDLGLRSAESSAEESAPDAVAAQTQIDPGPAAQAVTAEGGTGRDLDEQKAPSMPSALEKSIVDLEVRLVAAEQRIRDLQAKVQMLASQAQARSVQAQQVSKQEVAADSAHAEAPKVAARSAEQQTRRTPRTSQWLGEAARKYGKQYAIDHAPLDVSAGNVRAELRFNEGQGRPSIRLFRELGGKAVVLDVFNSISIRNAVDPAGPLNKVTVGHHKDYRRFVYQASQTITPQLEWDEGKMVLTMTDDAAASDHFRPIGLSEFPLQADEGSGSRRPSPQVARKHSIMDPSIQAAEIRRQRQTGVGSQYDGDLRADAAGSKASHAGVDPVARLQSINPQLAGSIPASARDRIIEHAGRMNFDASGEDIERASKWSVRAATNEAGVVFNRLTERIMTVQPGSEIPGAGTVLAMIPEAQMILTDIALLERQR